MASRSWDAFCGVSHLQTPACCSVSFLYTPAFCNVSFLLTPAFFSCRSFSHWRSCSVSFLCTSVCSRGETPCYILPVHLLPVALIRLISSAAGTSLRLVIRPTEPRQAAKWGGDEPCSTTGVLKETEWHAGATLLTEAQDCSVGGCVDMWNTQSCGLVQGCEPKSSIFSLF